VSIDIAGVLRDEAKTARAVAERVTNFQDKTVLQQLAAKLVEIAERLERDARDYEANAMQQPSPFGDPRAQFLRRLDRMLGEMNVLLTAVAVGLAVLDFTCFLALKVSAEIARSPEQVMPSISQPVAAIGAPDKARPPSRVTAFCRVAQRASYERQRA
jgi:hypothetical protein